MPAAVAKSISKSEIIRTLAEGTGLSKKEVASVFDALADLVKKDMSKKGRGVFNVVGLVKIKRVHKPATKAREGTNPFTGEKMMFKAKPARNVVKALPLKAIKDSVA